LTGRQPNPPDLCRIKFKEDLRNSVRRRPTNDRQVRMAHRRSRQLDLPAPRTWDAGVVPAPAASLRMKAGPVALLPARAPPAPSNPRHRARETRNSLAPVTGDLPGVAPRACCLEPPLVPPAPLFRPVRPSPPHRPSGRRPGPLPRPTGPSHRPRPPSPAPSDHRPRGLPPPAGAEPVAPSTPARLPHSRNPRAGRGSTRIFPTTYG
jgi:hypothetical protein